MGKLFKSKAEKEQERRMVVKRSMRELEKRINKLQQQEEVYVNAAKVAIKEGLPEQVKLAKEALKLTISERKRTYKMLLNAQIISQMKDMTQMTGEFLEAIRVISKDIAGTTTQDVSKLSGELKMAMEKVSDQTENLNEMLADSQDDITDFSTETKLVADEEVDKIIYGSPSAEGDQVAIDAELEALKKQLNS